MILKMILKRAIPAAALAALGLAAGIGPSLAAPAVATAHVNMRSGPGTGYAVIDQLRPGQAVDVGYCQGSWCFVNKPGPDGWVSAAYLARGSYGPRYDPLPAPPPLYIPPPRPMPPPVYIPPPPPVPRWDAWQGYPRWDNPWPRRSNSVCIGGPLGSFCVND